MDRQKIIVRTSVIGILANVFLAAFKAAVGLLANSISVVLDAVNNLSDALSSVITIIGAKLSVKPADKKHPLGYGRIEYLSSVIIAVIVLYAGISAAVESVKKIITPDAPDYSAVSLIIIGVAVLVKIILGTYVSRTGKKVNSDSLIASGKEADYDKIYEEVQARDYQDSHREVSPLRQAEDAVYLDTSDMTIEENIDAVADIITEKTGRSA